MKRTTIATVIMTAVVLVAVDASWAGRMNYRQGNQHRRIAQGVRTGEITNGELNRLNHEQWRIQRAKMRARADGRVTRRERRHINQMQNRASRHIYRAKHNYPASYRPVRPVYPRPVYVNPPVYVAPPVYVSPPVYVGPPAVSWWFYVGN